MASLTIRNLPDTVHEIIKHRAHLNHRSTEAEVRAILTTIAAADSGQGFGQALRERFKNFYGDELADLRDQTPAEGAVFE